jgi:FkbM family methyltransferase
MLKYSRILQNKILDNFFGSRFTAKFFNKLLRFALTGLNIGRGGEFKDSGELHVFKEISKRSKLNKEFIVFDVGSNIGKYSLELIRFFGTKLQLHAFEPSKSTFEVYRSNVGFHDNVVANNFGFSDSVCKLELYSDKKTSGLASVYNRNLQHFGIDVDIVEEVSLTTIDLYCAKNSISRINFLKLDVEGHELNALNGASGMMRDGNIDFIQFEFGGCNIDSRTFFQDFYYLLCERYNIYRVMKDGIYPIFQYSEYCEVFVTTNFFAVLKSKD